MTNTSYTENASALSGPNQSTQASGAVMNISGMLHYRFKTIGRRAFTSQFTFPLMASQGTYLSAGGGMEYYWGQASAQNILNDATSQLTLTPSFRYFALFQLNVGYIAYLTETAKKNDTLLEMEAGGGLSKKFNSWTLRAQAGIARGIGVTTTTMGMKAMIGGIFFLD
ncbi:MAG: hypothetical protein AB7I27_10210 [Bacteriovoracaceae bacterium]